MAPLFILGQLAEQHPFDLGPLQRNAWLSQINLLQTELSSDTEGWLALEFSIPRIGKRVDAITVQYGAPQPCYIPSVDRVEMPNYGSFKTDDDFASTLFHELVHASGHPSRLNRKLNLKVLKTDYAHKELIAELGSAFLCAHYGYSYMEAQSPAYIDGWLKVLKADSRAIFSIASYASHAADWLREREHAITGPDDPDLRPRRPRNVRKRWTTKSLISGAPRHYAGAFR